MTKHDYDQSVKVGMRPGTVIHIGEQKVESVRIRVMDYSPDSIEEKELLSIEECTPYKNTETVTWINIDGLHDTDIIEKIGKNFDINSLVLEDIVNTNQSPKFEEYDNYVFMTVKMIYYDEISLHINFEHFSFILGKNFVLTFQEKIGDVFKPVRERIMKPSSRLRNRKSDYLNYALLDVIIDNYLVVADKLSNNVDEMEDQLMDSPTQDTLKDMYRIKRELLKLIRNTRPAREVVDNFYNTESQLVEEINRKFIRDLYDHTIDVNANIEIYREMISGMIDTYISITGNKLNEIMKVLTIMASIFIPLTFIAGIYGMNFDNMPELHSRWGYPVTLLLMLVIGCGLIYYFKRKRWL